MYDHNDILNRLRKIVKNRKDVLSEDDIKTLNDAIYIIIALDSFKCRIKKSLVGLMSSVNYIDEKEE